MEYKDAKKFKVGDIINPRSVDINGKCIEPYGNYIIKAIDIQPEDIFITIDNGQIINHKKINLPILMGTKEFYCSWFGYTKNICHTNLTKEQLERTGVMVD